ncbi:MAG: hypothetical protein Q9227_004862 [Pyrenula ochraceoflavens]
MASNSAAWLTAAKKIPFEVGTAEVWKPEENEILTRNHAVAINPVDGSLQKAAWWPMNYPTILGQDVAGEVVAVGPNVTQFKKGDRVVGHAVGMATKRNQDNAFQAYTILQTNMTSILPDNVPYENAAVIPLACSTAACGLYQDGFLELQFPTEPRQRPTGNTLLVWGGSSSVGSNAIQLAIASGYDVITTCSPKNFDYVKKLGASQAFDYNSPTIAADLLGAFKGKTIAGALDAIGGETAWKTCQEVVHKTTGAKNIAVTKRGFPEPPEGVKVNGIFGTTLKDNQVGKAIYVDYLPKALKAGTFVPSPGPMIAGKGLESVQGAVDTIMKGVSATKVVVSLA